MSFAGKTVFITGASRGIGLAIGKALGALKANVVVAAKTATPHPALPGTVYTAAEEIVAAGGKSLPLVVDIRSESEVEKAVAEAVAKFGGIDILVNNASAISLTPTLATPAKKFDLMNQVNARGTYITSRACLPHLLKSANPHILNISPPLNMKPIWFKNHVAYTMAKYGMSMCVLGMAEEFREQGVSVNALWPRTAIATAAVENLLGGVESTSKCRKPEIMADAAVAILSRAFANDSTGQFFIDDEIVSGDLEKYSVTPGTKDFMPDFFLDSEHEEVIANSAHDLFGVKAKL